MARQASMQAAGPSAHPLVHVAAASQDGTARVWDVEIGDCVLVMEGHAGPVTNAALAGSVLVTSGQDSTVRVWDMEQGHCLHVLKGHTAAVNAVAITRDAKTAVSVSSDETARVWDLKTGHCLHKLPGRRSGADPLPPLRGACRCQWWC